MGYSKLSGDMVGVGYGGPDYSRLLGAGLGGGGVPGVPGQADYSKLLSGGSQGLYHSFMQNSYMTSQLNMSHWLGSPLPIIALSAPQIRLNCWIECGFWFDRRK